MDGKTKLVEVDKTCKADQEDLAYGQEVPPYTAGYLVNKMYNVCNIVRKVNQYSNVRNVIEYCIACQK